MGFFLNFDLLKFWFCYFEDFFKFKVNKEKKNEEKEENKLFIRVGIFN